MVRASGALAGGDLGPVLLGTGGVAAEDGGDVGGDCISPGQGRAEREPLAQRPDQGRVAVLACDDGARLDVGRDRTASYTYGDNASLLAIARDDRRIAFAYGASGALSAIASDGATTAYQIDELGQLLATSVPAGDSTVVDFETGIVNEPYVVEIDWGNGRDFAWVRPNGRLLNCTNCP